MTIDEALAAIRGAGLSEAADAVEQVAAYEQRLRDLAAYGYRVMQDYGLRVDPVYADLGLVKRVRFGELLKGVVTDYDVQEDRRQKANAVIDEALERVQRAERQTFTVAQVVALLEGIRVGDRR